MQIIDYFNCNKSEYWLCQIKKSDWSAGQYLYKLLSENNFKNTVGENSKVLLLANGDERAIQSLQKTYRLLKTRVIFTG